MGRRLALVAGLLACLLTSEVRLGACTCSPTAAPCTATFRSPIVFAGQVQRITEAGDDGFVTELRVTFVVSEVLRGSLGETVDVLTPSTGPACGYRFSAGGRYLVYVSLNREGRLATTRCSRTGPLAGAGEDLNYLRREWRARPESSRLQGEVRQVGATTGPWELWAGMKPFAAATVIVESNDRTRPARFETTSGPDGRYALAVPPGHYRVRVVVPDGMTADSQQSPGTVAEIFDPRGCGDLNFIVRPGRGG